MTTPDQNPDDQDEYLRDEPYPWQAWFESNQRGAHTPKPAVIRKTVAEKLHEKLLAAGYDVEIPRRCYHGSIQRSAGAWSWQAKRCDNTGDIGSQFSMTQCLTLPFEQTIDP